MNDGTPKTIAEALGQITWLFSQSTAHKQLRVGDLEWSVMPALVHEQFRIFRFGPLPGVEDLETRTLMPGFTKEGLERMPLGVALWGELSAEAEAKVERGERLKLEEWKSGDRLWLLELISPFATPENNLIHYMLADLVQGPFANRRFSLHRTNPATGLKDKISLDASDVGAAPGVH
jgi:cytolysin-activating lysine-acyltransferase